MQEGAIPHVGVIPDITLVAEAVIFLIFMFIMNKIFFEPYLDALEERTLTASNYLKEAEVNRKKTEEILKEVEKILNETKLEAQKILDEEHKKTNEIVAEILRKASEEAEQKIAKAKKEIEMSLDKEKKIMDSIIENIADEIVNKLTLREKEKVAWEQL